jgi:hypothetical protein
MDPRLEFLTRERRKANLKPQMTNSMTRELEEIRSIMIRDPRQPSHQDEQPTGGQLQYARNVVNRTMQTVIDSENIVQLLPEMELAIQVLISQILSPKDLITVSLIYESKSDVLGEVSAILNKKIADHMELDYKIIGKLKGFLRETLFLSGSKPLAVIPRSRIDSIINSGTRNVSAEAFNDVYHANGTVRNIGVIGNSGKTVGNASFRELAMENFASCVNPAFDPVVGHPSFQILVTDNPDILKVGELMERMRGDRMAEAYGTANSLSTESLDIDTSGLYRPKLYRQATILDMTDRAHQKSYDADGEPLIFDFPSESVFPVYPPSDPTKHLGYYVALDPNGQFVKRASVHDFYRQFGRGQQGTGQTSQMLERMRMTLSDFGNAGADDEAMFHIFSKVVEEDLAQRFKNGINAGADAKLGYSEEVRRIMFARACMQMQTQLLFIPTTYMTYFAFDYNENGVGKSLTENTKLLASYRAIAGMANVFAMIKNSINYRKMNIALDPRDPDPDRTIEFAVHELARQTSGEFPIGEQNPAHISSYLQNAGLTVAVTGHPRIPSTTIEIESNPASNVQVNTELEELLENRHNAALGVPTEAINSAADVNYVAQILQSNLLSAKRAITYQETFCPQLTDHVRKYAIAHGGLMNELEEVVRKNRKVLVSMGVTDKNTDRQIIMHHLNNMDIVLPRPDFNQLSTQLEEFKVYSESVDAILATTVNAELFGSDPDTQLSTIGNQVETLKNIFKSYLERKWLKDRGVMPEVFELFADLKNEDNLLQSFLVDHRNLANGIREVALKLIKTNHTVNKATDAYMAKMAEDNSDSAGESSSGNESESGDDESDDGDSEDSGFDDSFSDEGGGGGEDENVEDSDTGADEESSTEDVKETKDDKTSKKESAAKVDDAFSTDD